MPISEKLDVDNKKELLLDKIDSFLMSNSRRSESQLQLTFADLPSERKQKRLTKKELCSLNLSQLMWIFRELHPNETYDPGYGCRSSVQRKRAYADVVYNGFRYYVRH